MILVDNAIRHSPTDGRVGVAVQADSTGASLVVEDEGPGIRPEDLPHVFERFYRAPGAPGGGTGLGLAIAAWIVDRHGGRIEAANRVEGGARFVVRLPAGGAAAFAATLLLRSPILAGKGDRQTTRTWRVAFLREIRLTAALRPPD